MQQFQVWLKTFQDTGQFAPHGYCLLWEPWLINETVIGNLMIWIAYCIIPVQLFLMYRKAGKRNLVLSRNRSVTIVFALFIFCCGISHLIDFFVMFIPLYWLQAHWLTITGIVSLTASAVTCAALRVDGHEMCEETCNE